MEGESVNFVVIGSAHGHIYEFITDMLSLGWNFLGLFNDGSDITYNILKSFGVPVFNDINKLLDQNISVAGTSAINNKKIDIIELCNEKGIHIIADKPIVANEEQYNRLEKIISQGKIEVGLMLSVRFMPEIYALKNAILDNVIGNLISVEIFNPHKLTPDKRPSWAFDNVQSGGVIIDLLVHSIDLYNWLTEDEICDYQGVVQKSILKEKGTFFDSTQVLVISKNGTSGYFRASWHMTESHWTWGDFRVFCSGTKGSVEVRALGDPLTREPVVVLYEEGKETRKLKVEEYKNSVTKDFIDRVNKKNHVIGHKDILDATRITVELDKKAKRIII